MPFSKSKLVNLLILILISIIGGIFGSFFYNTTLFDNRQATKETSDSRYFLRERLTGSGIYSPSDVSRLNTYAAGSVALIFKKKFGSPKDVLDSVYLGGEQLSGAMVVTADGWIVTAPNSLRGLDKDSLIVSINKGFYDVQKIVFDPLRKATYLKINANNLPVLKFADSDELKFGETLFAVAGRNKIASSVVFDIAWKDSRQKNILISISEELDRYVLLAHTLSSEFLGAPVLDINGAVKGIIRDISVGGRAAFVPINNIRRSVGELLGGKKFSRNYLGVSYLDLNYLKTANLKEGRGFLIYDNPRLGIRGVAPASPAALASLQAGDTIIKVNNLEARGPLTLAEILDEYKSGEALNFTVLREEKELSLKVVLEEK